MCGFLLLSCLVAFVFVVFLFRFGVFDLVCLLVMVLMCLFVVVY